MHYSRTFISSTSLLLSLVVLGLLGETTPSSLRLIEIVQFICIVFSFIAVQTLSYKFTFPILFLLLSILLIGLIGAMLNNNSPGNIFRDLVPYLFLMLFFPLSKYDIRENIYVLYGLVFVGVCFSFRFIIGAGSSLDAIGSSHFSDKTYLMQDPACLFSGLWLVHVFVDCLQNKKYLQSILFGFLGVIVFIGFLLMGVRAAIGLIGFYAIIVILSLKINLIVKIIFLYGILMLIVNTSIFYALLEKFSGHGLNNKDVEFFAVLEYLSQSVENIFVGKGFGGTFQNPVYGFEVRYTHSIISYFFLKFGLLGFIFSIFLVFCHLTLMFTSILKFILKPVKINSIMVSLSLSIVPSMYLQPTFKSLSFAILLGMLIIIGTKKNDNSSNLNSQRRTSY